MPRRPPEVAKDDYEGREVLGWRGRKIPSRFREMVDADEDA